MLPFSTPSDPESPLLMSPPQVGEGGWLVKRTGGPILDNAGLVLVFPALESAPKVYDELHILHAGAVASPTPTLRFDRRPSFILPDRQTLAEALEDAKKISEGSSEPIDLHAWMRVRYIDPSDAGAPTELDAMLQGGHRVDLKIRFDNGTDSFTEVGRIFRMTELEDPSAGGSCREVVIIDTAALQEIMLDENAAHRILFEPTDTLLTPSVVLAEHEHTRVARYEFQWTRHHRKQYFLDLMESL